MALNQTMWRVQASAEPAVHHLGVPKVTGKNSGSVDNFAHGANVSHIKKTTIQQRHDISSELTN